MVTSPVPASGEAALAGVSGHMRLLWVRRSLREAKKVSIEEIYLQSQLANDTNATGDQIARLFGEVKNQTENRNLQDPADIQNVVVNVALDMNINLSDNQSPAGCWIRLQHPRGFRETSRTLKQKLESMSQQAGGADILQQIYDFPVGIQLHSGG